MSNKQKINESEFMINEMIRYPEVRITGDGIENKVISTYDAKKLAQNLNLDLVLISTKSNPPVCRLCDYNKFLYELKKKRKEQDKKVIKTKLKTLKLSYTIDEHDINFKVKNATEWLKRGDKVKCVIQFPGRTIQFTDMGEKVLKNICNMLADYSKIETPITLSGKVLSVTLISK